VGDVRDSSLRGVVADPPVSETTNVTPESLAGNSQVPADRVVLGTGEFVQGARGPERTVFAGDDGVTLNFENAELHEFLRAVFDTILKQNYIVDPAVGGRVTLHTTRPITPEAVLPTVESVLQLNGAAMLYDDGAYRIMPLADAAQSSRSPSIGRTATIRIGDRNRKHPDPVCFRRQHPAR
jgi:general secretion pathway protein D